MSYILEALKKSEQERGRGDIPDVQTVHSSSLRYRGEEKSYWPYLLIIAILLNLAAIVYFNLDDERVSASDTATITEAPSNASGITTTVPLQEATVNKTVAQMDPEAQQKTGRDDTSDAEMASSPIAETPNREPVETTAVDQHPVAEVAHTEIISYYDLPESVSSQLPVFTISAHVYSSNPLQRSIVINNNFMEEGEYVLDGLALYEITPDGAIFDYNGTLFSYAVVSGWQ